MLRILLGIGVAGIWVLGAKSVAAKDAATPCPPSDPARQMAAAPPTVPPTVQGVLDLLRQRTERIRTYQAKVRYLFIQEPELLDSRTLNQGVLFYVRDPNNAAASRLRINFFSRKQDEEKEVPHREEFLFDGVWLTRLDYQLDKVDRYQKAPPDKPIDVFELIQHNFPIIGFTRTAQLAAQFDITLLDDHKAKADAPVHLRLKVKKTSKYKDDYESIDFWIDRTLFLPRRIVTTSTQGDVYDITFLEPKLNKKLPGTIFAIEVPADFRQNDHPLEPPTPQPADEREASKGR